MKQPIFRSFLILLFIGQIQCQRSSLNSPTTDGSNEKTGIHSCQIQSTPKAGILAVISCPDGSNLEIPENKDGSDGVNGVNGTSCSVDSVTDGALISCEDGSQAFVKNGLDGSSCTVSSVDAYSSLIQCSDGSQSLIDLTSLASFTVQEFIDPCGDDPDYMDEVLLLFTNGDIVAYFESGSQRFLSRLTPGNYQTTDKQKCSFSIASDGSYLAL